MYRRFLVFSSKILIKVLRLIGKNGSALPGLVIERLCTKFLSATLQPVEKNIILVTGTNGKTTTTKMLVAALRGAGKRVVTNGTGSNMTRGSISALVEDMSFLGSLRPTDWYVFEMDEAYAPIFTQKISPHLVLGLNVLRDQLDRYGELDTTAQFIGDAARRADLFVFNNLDPLLRAQAQKRGAKAVVSFGADTKLYQHVANEQTVHGSGLSVPENASNVRLVDAVDSGNGQKIVVSELSTQEHQFTIPVQGFHNALNAAAVVAVLLQVLNKDINSALQALSEMPTPFGRGENLHIQDKDLTVALVKNPSGFTTNLKTFASSKSAADAILFVVNDNIADGRDVSWLWDVDLESLLPKNTPMYVSGIRAYDMALRLKQAGYTAITQTNVQTSIKEFMRSDYKKILIIPTYTALFEVRTALSKYGKVPRIW